VFSVQKKYNLKRGGHFFTPIFSHHFFAFFTPIFLQKKYFSKFQNLVKKIGVKKAKFLV